MRTMRAGNYMARDASKLSLRRQVIGLGIFAMFLLFATVANAGSAATPATGSFTISGSEQSTTTGSPTPGTGSVTISGTLQSWQSQTAPATGSTGSVTIGGTLQSKQVQTASATAGHGTVSITGGPDQSMTFDPCSQSQHGSCPQTVWNGGTITVTINGYQASAGYGATSTTSSIASDLASSLNGSTSVNATASGGNVNITAKTTGSSTNYTYSTTISYNNGTQPDGQEFFPGPPFSSFSGALTGGADATFNTIHDFGTTTITINGQAIASPWSGPSTTSSSIASDLVSRINTNSSYATALPSGSTVSLASRTPGGTVNYSLSSSSTYDTSNFSTPSFVTSNSGPTMTGGADAQNTTNYDSGTTAISVNGHSTFYPWSGASTTAASIASGLAQAITQDPSAFVNAASSGATINLTARTAGPDSNYSLSTNTTSSRSSFSSSASGPALVGGANASPTYDTGTVSVTINGTTVQSSYDSSSTAASIAGDLQSKLPSSLVTASSAGTTVNMTTVQTGSAANYSLSGSSSTSQPGTFSSPSFSISLSGSALTGGTDAVTGPSITSLSPISGPVGTSVTITGSGFGSTQGTSTVTFSGVTATVSSWSDTSIAVTVPNGASTGNVVVTVSGVSTTGTHTFTVIPPPSISNLSPSSGIAGTMVTITGTNFGSTQGTSTVTFNGATATANSWSNTSIAVTAPGGATTGNVVVTVNGISTTGTHTFTFQATPTISGMSPSSGGVGTVVTITGANLGTTGTVTFNGAPASPWGWSPTLITVPVPGNASSGSVIVTIGGVQLPAAGSFTLNSTIPSTATEYSYDPMGRVAQTMTCTPMNCGTGQGFLMTYAYDLAGNLTTLTSNGTSIQYSPADSPIDGAGRVTKVESGWVDGTHPAVLATIDPAIGYSPSGALQNVKYGNNIYESTVYNHQGQPCRVNVNTTGAVQNTCESDQMPSGNIQDFTLNYNEATADNGNVVGFAASGQQNFNRSYGYDSLNRIHTMSAPGDACSGLLWNIDAWGNRIAQTTTGGACFSPQISVDTNNRITGASPAGCAATTPFCYDAAGNLLNDGNHTYTYDAENRVTQVDNGNTASYLYDASGNRADKTVSGTDSEYLYDAAGQLNSVFGNGVLQRMYVYLNAKQLAEYVTDVNTTYFIQTDHLGSTRLLTGMDQSVQESDDYYPYGEPITAGTQSLLKFTGKERDSESGLDYFGARYHANGIGRWLSPDPVVISPALENPQSWNKYSYVFNRPLTHVDADGEWPTWYHHIIIQDTFGNLGAHDVSVLEQASDWVDSVTAGNQAPERSFMHAMRDGEHGQTVEDAEQQSNNYVDTELGNAVTAQLFYESQGGKGYGDAALTSFGYALHTVTDSTSPEHTGFQPWYCLSCLSAYSHHKKEERSAKSSDAADEEARYLAHVKAEQLWQRFLQQLKTERAEEEKQCSKNGGCD
jgi:RHS repeat-associated protein